MILIYHIPIRDAAHTVATAKAYDMKGNHFYVFESVTDYIACNYMKELVEGLMGIQLSSTYKCFMTEFGVLGVLLAERTSNGGRAKIRNIITGATYGFQ